MAFNFSLLNTAGYTTLCRMVDLSSSSSRLHLAILLMFILSFFYGCAAVREAMVKSLPPPSHLEEKIETNDFSVAKEDDVIGRLAVIRLEEDDTLPDIARHFSSGLNTVSAANPGIDIWVPEGGDRILLPLSFILPDTVRKGIVINLAAMRLFHFREDGKQLAVSTYPIGIGTTERPTPMGQMYIVLKIFRPTWHVPASIAEDHRKKGDPLPAKVPPGPLNPLGEHALYLSKSGYLVHGTNKPTSIGLRATNGCIRLYPEDIKRLFENTSVKTPVNIVNQPYLVGQRDGIVYIEVHTPFEDSGMTELEKAYAKLENIEKKSGRALDWKRVKDAVAEARGIPVPVFEIRPGSEKGVAKTIELKHPGKLYGKPEIPELKTDAWYVLAAILHDKVDALRLAAIINHQGPQIPARVLSKNDRHRVLAGPFNNLSQAKDAAKRLKIDLGIDGILVEP
jgi:L,D-transpeptidase ErfK/SrfK